MPHSMKRFPGYDNEAGEFHADVHRDHIFGKHVGNYMRLLQEDDEDQYKRQFSQYIKNGINPDNLEEMYKTGHSAIRNDPEYKPEEKKQVKVKRWNRVKLYGQQRNDRIKQKKEVFLKKLSEGGD